ncbi:MAG: ABC transporter permease subunit [Saccharofermentans sp.]|nr:ABC transporter permease subunit [Saccharofermentans sp.]
MANTNRTHKGMSYSRFGYIFVAPFVIAYCIFSLYPLLTTFWYSTANMQATTSAFWGFSNKEVYYDRYLDLNEIYDDLSKVDIDSSGYNKIKNFFAAQDYADRYHPLDEDGMTAITSIGTSAGFSSTTISEVQAAVDNQDVGQISTESYDELKGWRSGFSDISLTLTDRLSTYSGQLDAIVNAETAEEGEETESVTPETIMANASYTDFVASLADLQLDANQQILVDYLLTKTSYTSLQEYFDAITDGEASMADPAFYYVISNLNSPSVTTEDGEAVTAIAVPFISDVETYLKAEIWKDTISNSSSYTELPAYIDGSKALTDNMDQLYADIKDLNDAGIINAEVLVIKGGEVVVSDDTSGANFLAVYDKYYVSADTPYQSNPDEIAAAMQISNLGSYYELAARTKLVSMGVALDKYITYEGDFDVDKYNEFKAEVGMADVLTMDKYKEIDEQRMAERVEKAEEKVAEAEAKLPEVQAAYDAAVAADEAAGIENPQSVVGTDSYKAYGDLRSVELQIQKNESIISDPKGVLEEVNAKKMYISVGLDNYKEIFTNKTRFSYVTGAFVTTAVVWIIGFVPQILLALLLSAWFTDTKLSLKGLSAMKALMYLPNVITAATIAIFFRRLFSYSSGGALSASQLVLRAFGDEDGYNFFASPWATRLIVCFINFWMWYGNTMIVLIAGITSINESIYESAQLDGASSFQTYTKITLPLLRPIILYTLVTSLIGGLQMFDIPQNLNMNPALVDFNGVMIPSIRTVLMYVNAAAFGKQDVKLVGIASAVSVLLFIVTTILSIIIFYIMRDKDAAKAKKLMKKGGTK